MTTEELIKIENDLLQSELGNNPRYAWKHTSKLRFRVQKIVESATAPGGIEPQYKYIANPRTGIVELKPEYIDMPMLPMLPDSWVLARFHKADQDQAMNWKFGSRVEYPIDGIWQPIAPTAMRAGLIPSRTDTWAMIHGVRKNNLHISEYLKTAEADQDRREKASIQRNVDACRDRFSVGMEVPGTKGAVSVFSAKPNEEVTIKRGVN